MTVAVIGGGIAGLSAALSCAQRGSDPVVVLEREDAPFTSSSGRNAAIFRPLEVQHSLVTLASRARSLYRALDPTIVRYNGLCLVSRHESALEPLLGTARELELEHELWSGSTLFERAPWLLGGSSHFGLFLPQGGTIDLVRLREALVARVARAGVSLRTGARVAALETASDRISGIRLHSGERIATSTVVNAAGAWAHDLGAGIGHPFPLVCHRRHLALLDPGFDVDPSHPVCWNIETEIYFRPHGNLVLACPGDDTPHEPTLPVADPTQITVLMQALREQAPVLADASVTRSWACLRTRSGDGSMAIGPDPARHGLYWLAGLGGHGMTVGLAAGELLARQIHGEPDALVESFAVTRFAP